MIRCKKWQIVKRSGARGQGLVELALILPFLALLLLGVIEMGFALYDYITLASANREGVRLASRARFTDNMVADLVVGSSGLVEQDDGSFVPNMRLQGEDANLGVIIIHLSLDVDGNLIDASIVVTGTIVESDGTRRLITPADTTFTPDRLSEIATNSSNATAHINAYRDAQTYDMIPEEIVIVETFLAHDVLYSTIIPMNDVITLHFHSTMRVIRDSRQTQ